MYILCVCITYNCTVHGADLTNISLLVILCIIVYVTNKNLESYCSSFTGLQSLESCGFLWLTGGIKLIILNSNCPLRFWYFIIFSYTRLYLLTFNSSFNGHCFKMNICSYLSASVFITSQSVQYDRCVLAPLIKDSLFIRYSLGGSCKWRNLKSWPQYKNHKIPDTINIFITVLINEFL